MRDRGDPRKAVRPGVLDGKLTLENIRHQMHAMRNIGMLMSITGMMAKHCPDAWLLNLTNPMSMLCTYLMKHTNIKSAGFCHQVHGSLGVIAEQFGFEPGEFQVISAGINHLNWLFDLRRRSNGKSYLKEFLTQIETSLWWTEKHKGVPAHRFSLELYKTFGMYPIGYDDHIWEYVSCFPEKEEWEDLGIESYATSYLKPALAAKETTLERALKEQKSISEGNTATNPFPKSADHPYYREVVCATIAALETNEPLYLDAMVGLNHGSVSNLPTDAVLDRPVVVVGGAFRSVEVGALSSGPAEICRRQITIHEMVVKAVVEGDENLAVQALSLDRYVRTMSQARNIWSDFRKENAKYLPTFH